MKKKAPIVLHAPIDNPLTWIGIGFLVLAAIDSSSKR